jgi:hypothetical protein
MSRVNITLCTYVILQSARETGILAQELAQVFPDAVKIGTEAVQLANGDTIKDFHTVNKDRLYMANIASTQELHKQLVCVHLLLGRFCFCLGCIEGVAYQTNYACTSIDFRAQRH